MSTTSEIVFKSGNAIRNGYMGFVIHLTDKVKKIAAERKLGELSGANEVFDEEW